MALRLRSLLLVGALAIGGCIIRSGPNSGDDANNAGGGGGGAAAIVVANRSSTSICFVNFSPATDSGWGDDQLGSSETIEPGNTRSWNVNAGSWDVRLQDCNHTVLAERRGLAINGATEVSYP